MRVTVWLAGGTGWPWPKYPPPVLLADTPGLAVLAQAMDEDVAEADWWRLLDALLLVATHPAVSQDATR